jgi:Fe-S-cluster-containing hydrogenase component 2
MQILVREARCSGCRACEVACVGRHEGRFGTATARIRVRKIEHLGFAGPELCRPCTDAPCVAACPTSALSRDAVTSAILLNPDDCLVCSICTDACSFGLVSIHPASGLPLICDLCGGDPACVKRCVTGALAWDDTAAPGDSGRAGRA